MPAGCDGALLLEQIDALLPSSLPPDIREEAFQELALLGLTSDEPLTSIIVTKCVRRVWRESPGSKSRVSLDQCLNDDGTPWATRLTEDDIRDRWQRSTRRTTARHYTPGSHIKLPPELRLQECPRCHSSQIRAHDVRGNRRRWVCLACRRRCSTGLHDNIPYMGEAGANSLGGRNGGRPRSEKPKGKRREHPPGYFPSGGRPRTKSLSFWCPRCGSDVVISRGVYPSGHRKFRCHPCGRFFSLGRP